MSEQAQIQLIVTLGGIGAQIIGMFWWYLKLKAGQDDTQTAIQSTHTETTTAIQENTDKTEAIGVAVNGRVEALVKEKVDAIELAYQAKLEAAEARIAALQVTLNATAKPAESPPAS